MNSDAQKKNKKKICSKGEVTTLCEQPGTRAEFKESEKKKCNIYVKI